MGNKESAAAPDESAAQAAPAAAPDKTSKPEPAAQASTAAAPKEAAKAATSDATPPDKAEGAAPKGKAKGEGKPQRVKPDKGCLLIIKNLSEDTTQDTLQKAWANTHHAGTVTRIDVKTKKDTGKCNGTAFVTFSTAEDAARAQADMDKAIVDGKEISINVVESKEGQSKGEKGEKGKGKGKGEKGKASDNGKGKGKGKKTAQQNSSNYGYSYDYAQYYAAMQQQMAYYAQMQYMAQFAQMQQQQQQQQPAAASTSASSGAPWDYTTEYEGTLKSMSGKHSYGFIDWPLNNTNKWFCQTKGDSAGKPRQVYIAGQLLPEGSTEIGTKLKFTIGLSEKGHPQAKTCRVVA